MRKGFLASVAALAAGAGFALGQAPPGASSSDPAAVSTTSTPMLDPNVVQAWSRGPLYLQGGEAESGVHRPHSLCLFGLCGANGCGADGCGDSKCGWGCDENAKQVHKAAGGPDCFYFDIDLLYYYFRSMPIAAPVLTSGPIGSAARPGVDEGTQILFGDRNVDFGPMATLRLTMGFWDDQRICGFEARAFLTEQKAEVDRFDAPINGRTVLARPNINVLTGVPDSILISSPPNFGGSAGIYTNSRAGGAETNFLRNWAYYDKFKFTSLVGLRWMTLNEQLRIDSTAVIPGADPNDPSFRDITDNISTRNNYYGAQIGFQTEARHGRWFMDSTAKIAGGFTHEKLNMSGFTRFTDAGISNTIPFGAYVLEPNSGKFSDKEWSYLPEFDLKIGYQWTQRLSTYIGYNVIYLSQVVRPGDQINPNVNPTLLPISQVFNPQFPFGPPEPSLKFDKSDFWMQGIQFGLSYRY